MSRFIHINDVVDLPLLGNDDELRRGKMRLLKWAKYVYEDMNMDVMKIAVRKRFYINKRTNSIDMPCETSMLSSINVTDRYGNLYPVWRNNNLNQEFPAIEAAKNCACEYACGHALCNMIKGYEAITTVKTDKMPNGDDVEFTCVDRKWVAGEIFYEQTQTPLRQYISGVWTDTILHTETRELCKVQVDENGCVCDTEENVQALCGTCGSSNMPYGGNAEEPPCEGVTSWTYYCNTGMDFFAIQCGEFERLKNSFRNIYNIDETGDRIIFPHDFAFDSVVIRYYENVGLSNMKIPMIAVPVFVDGLKWFDVRWNDRKQSLEPRYAQKYATGKFALLSTLNKYRLAEWSMILTPPVYVPSYISNRYW